MMIVNINSGNGAKCGFCKHWYDPGNKAISPKAPNIGLWNCDDRMRAKCLVRNLEMKACSSCGKFESKM